MLQIKYYHKHLCVSSDVLMKGTQRERMNTRQQGRVSSQVVCRPLTVQLIHYSDWDDNRSLCLFVGVPVTRFIHSFLPLAFLFALQISFIRFFLHFKCHFTASICDCPSVSLIVHPSVCLWWLLRSVTWIFLCPTTTIVSVTRSCEDDELLRMFMRE